MTEEQQQSERPHVEGLVTALAEAIEQYMVTQRVGEPFSTLDLFEAITVIQHCVVDEARDGMAKLRVSGLNFKSGVQ